MTPEDQMTLEDQIRIEKLQELDKIAVFEVCCVVVKPNFAPTGMNAGYRYSISLGLVAACPHYPDLLRKVKSLLGDAGLKLFRVMLSEKYGTELKSSEVYTAFRKEVLGDKFEEWK